MARSLSIAAYLAGRGAPVNSRELTTLPPRPMGTIIWARCSRADQVTAIETLGRKLAEDGDPIQIIITVKRWDDSLSSRALPEPEGKDNIRKFMAHWKPMMAIWVRGDLDPILLEELRLANVTMIMVDGNGEGLEQVAGGWVPGAMRSLLSQFEAVLALDQGAAERLIRAGTPHEIVRVSGALEDCDPPLPCSDAERTEMAATIGTRPVWLAAAAQLRECTDLAAAHRHASSSAHRLLLIIVPRSPAMATLFLAEMQKAGFYTKLRSEEPEPLDPTQVYIVDTEEGLGLWYRIAPVTYMGGTLERGGCRDPFEPAALGSAVIYGPHVSPYERHGARLNAAGASRLLRSARDLGPAVEELLSASKAATLAHAAWDVTSRGADVTNRVAKMIMKRLEEMGV